MSMNPGQFLKNLDRIVTGCGYKKQIAGIGIDNIHLASGAPLAADGGNPMRATLETYFEGVQLASSQTALGTLTFTIPEDYDESVDKLRIEFLAESAGDTDTPTIDASIYRKRAGAALSADIDPTISAAVPTNTSGAAWRRIVSDGDGWQAGDAVTCIFASSAHTTDALNVYGLKVIYAGCIVHFDPNDRDFE